MDDVRRPQDAAQAETAGRTLGDHATAKAMFFAAALLSLLVSVLLFFSGEREQGIFVGIWVPSILAAGSLVLQRGTHHE